MPKRRGSQRIYWRERGDEPRAYGDFRDFRDVGGGREALKPPGARRATTDPELAEKLASDRVEELRERRRRKVLHGIEVEARLKSYGSHHLTKKAKSGSVTADWLSVVENHLREAVAFFGEDRDLNSIRPPDVERWVAHLRKLDNGMGGTLSESSVRKYLNSLSNLYRRAQSENAVPSGYNPVAGLMDKPTDTAREADWLEVSEAALYLEAARVHESEKRGPSLDGIIHPLIATFLLTGGRKSEVLGLTVEDVSFDRQIVTFRPHDHRRLKTSTSHRSVPLWPQLEETLREYVFGGSGPRSGVLFPSPRSGGMLRDLRATLDAIADRAGVEDGKIRTKMFRHSYCAARLQTVDGGKPVAKYTVAQEMGHGGTSLVDRVYGHLGTVRHRSEVVEYRTENHEKELGERLKALQAAG